MLQKLQPKIIFHGTAHLIALLTTEHKQTQHHLRTLSKSCYLMQMAFPTKQIKCNYLLKIRTQADVITIQKIKLNQCHKTPSIPHFTSIRTDCT